MLSSLTLQPVPTGDATARYERLSHGGATWHDLMPTPANGTDGTTGAAFTWPNFNGESFVTIGNPAKLNFAGAYTVTAWALQDPNIPHQGGEYIIGKDNGGNRDFILTPGDDSSQITAFCWLPGFTSAQSPATYPAGAWYFCAVVNEGVGGDLLLYLNGVPQPTTGAGGTANWKGAAAWEFGRPNSGADDYFTGQIDTGRFYSRALSPDEILRDYHAGKPAHP
jgi:hypothetical protein